MVRVVVEVDNVGNAVVVEVDMVDNEVVVVVEVDIEVAVDVVMAVTVPDCGFSELCVSNVCNDSVVRRTNVEVLKEVVTSLYSWLSWSIMFLRIFILISSLSASSWTSTW